MTTMVSYQTRKIIDKSEQNIILICTAVYARTIRFAINMMYIYKYLIERRRIIVVYWVASNSLVFYGGQTFFPLLKTFDSG